MAKRTRKSTISRRERQQAFQKKRQRQNRIISVIGMAVAVVVIGLIAWQLWPQSSAGEGTIIEGERPLAALAPAERNNYYSAYPEMVIDTSKEYEAIIRTQKGDMRLALFDDEAPLTVNNFVFLANQGFYDGTTFHRVLADFMAQGGDPAGSGGGGPGYQFEDEFDTGFVFDRRGLLAMANSNRPEAGILGTNGSQFFITFVPTPHLNGRHTIFGELIEGDEVLSSLTLRDPTVPADAAVPGDVIERIDIVEK